MQKLKPFIDIKRLDDWIPLNSIGEFKNSITSIQIHFSLNNEISIH